MKALLTIAILGLLCLGSIECASASEEGIEFRTDICTRQQDGYHTYRIPTMVVTATYGPWALAVA